VLFQHPAVHTAPYWARGKIARALAGKASIAARVDAGGRRKDVGPALRASFEVRLASILRQGPPKKAPSGRGAPAGRAPFRPHGDARRGPPKGRGGPRPRR